MPFAKGPLKIKSRRVFYITHKNLYATHCTVINRKRVHAYSVRAELIKSVEG